MFWVQFLIFLLLMNFIKVSEYRRKFHKSRRDNKNPCWNKTRANTKSSQPWKGGKLGWPSRGFVQRGQRWKPEKYPRAFRIAGEPECSCLQRKQFSFKHSNGIASMSTEKNLLFLWIVFTRQSKQEPTPMWSTYDTFPIHVELVELFMRSGE